MWDDDRDIQNDLEDETLPASSLRITARMAALRASSPDGSSPGTRTGAQPNAPRKRPTDRPFETLGTSRITAAQPRVTAEQPHVTSMHPRVTGAPARVTPRMASVSGRQTAKMRRLRPEETALVEHTTQVLEVVEAMREQSLVARDEHADAGQAVTIVPVQETALLPALGRSVRPPARPRSWLGIAATWGLAGVLIWAVLASIGPLAGQRGAPQAFTPRAILLASDGTIPHPSGPWDASAGALNDLGVGGGAGPGVKAPGTAGLPVSTATKAKPQPTAAPRPAAPAPAPAPAPAISAPPVSPWPPADAYMAVPGHPGYALAEPSPDNYWWAWGQCTWWAQHNRQDENLKGMGNAQYWAGGAAARGYYVTGTPKAGATVVFQPGVQGAGGAGHVAHVVAVYPGGWFLVSEMNFFWNGGGWARVDYRFAHTGSGVAFIY
jgi:CHAP domain